MTDPKKKLNKKTVENYEGGNIKDPAIKGDSSVQSPKTRTDIPLTNIENDPNKDIINNTTVVKKIIIKRVMKSLPIIIKIKKYYLKLKILMLLLLTERENLGQLKM